MYICINKMTFGENVYLIVTCYLLKGKLQRCKLCKKAVRDKAMHLKARHTEKYDEWMLNRPLNTYKVGNYWVKDYCEKISHSEYQCNVCFIKIKMRVGMYGNMKRHIKSKHSDIYEQESVKVHTVPDYNIENDMFENASSDDELVSDDGRNYRNMKLPAKTKFIIKKCNEQKLLRCKKCREVVESSLDHLKAKHPREYTSLMNEGPIEGSTDIPVRSAWVKDYCKQLGEKEFECSICSLKLKMRLGMYSNMKRHIKRWHPSTYAKETVTLQKVSLDGDKEQEYFEIINSDEEATKVAARTKAIEKCIARKPVQCKLCREVVKDSTDHLKCLHPSEYEEWKTLCSLDDSDIDLPQKSWIKGYCAEVEDSMFQCNICGVVLDVQPGTYSSMRRHVRKVHPDIYKQENRRIAEYLANYFDSPESEDVTQKVEMATIMSGSCFRSAWIYTYCKKTTRENQFRCKFCPSLLKLMKGHYTNLKRHIRIKHPEMYNGLLRHAKASKVARPPKRLEIAEKVPKIEEVDNELPKIEKVEEEVPEMERTQFLQDFSADN